MSCCAFGALNYSRIVRHEKGYTIYAELMRAKGFRQIDSGNQFNRWTVGRLKFKYSI